MSRKTIIIAIIIAFLFQGLILSADAGQQKTPKKILKKMKKAAKYIEKAKKAKKPEKRKSYIDDATELYDEVIKIDENYAPAYFQKARISLLRRELDKAMGLVQKTISLDKNNLQAQATLAKIYLQQATNFQKKKDYKNMLAYQKKFVEMPFAKEKMMPKYSITLYLIGVYETMFKNVENGNKYLLKHIALFKDKEKSQTYNFSVYTIGINLMSMMEKKLDAEKAKTDPKKAKEIAAKFSDIEKYLGETIKAPVAKWTEDAFLRLGTYYIYKGDKKKAKEIITELISKFPTSKDIEVYNKLLKETIKKMK